MLKSITLAILLACILATCVTAATDYTTYYYQSDCTVSAVNQAGSTIQTWQYALSGNATYLSTSPPEISTPLSIITKGIYIEDIPKYQVKGTLFEGISLIPKIGETLWMSSNSDDPDYTQFITALTYPGSGYALGLRCSLIDATGYVLTGNADAKYISGSQVVGKIIGRVGLTINSASTWSTTSSIETPEPGTIVGMFVGLSGFGALLRRKR